MSKKKGSPQKDKKTIKERYPYSPPPKKIKYLTDNTQEMTVMARIMRANVKYLKTFRVSEYKGWTQARTAGKKWIKEQLESLPDHQMWKPGTMTKKNRSGIVGMVLSSRTMRSAAGRSYTYWSWSASWHSTPKRSTLYWQIGKFTEEEAFILAYLTLEMKTLDRKKVLDRFKKVSKTARYEEILSQRTLTVRQEQKRRGMVEEPKKKGEKVSPQKRKPRVQKKAAAKKSKTSQTTVRSSPPPRKQKEEKPPPARREELEIHLL